MSDTEDSIRPRFQEVPTVTFFVGTEKTVFHVHESILFGASDVFKTVFTGGFRESCDRSMSLLDEDVGAVERMIQWLYSGSIEATKITSMEGAEERYWQLAKLNTLADKFNIEQLKNDIVDELYEIQKPQYNKIPNRIPKLDLITYIYTNTSEQSSFRKLMVAWYAWHINLDWFDSQRRASELADIPEFSADLAVALAIRIKHPERKSLFQQDRLLCYEKDNEASQAVPTT